MNSIILKRTKMKVVIIVVMLGVLLAFAFIAANIAEADTVSISPGNNCLTFSSPTSFAITAPSNWDGTLYYSTNNSTWATWDGAQVNSVKSGNSYYLYFCGSENTVISGFVSEGWVITGSNVSVDGNIETLLDYATVAAGNHPQMEESCFCNIFAGNTSLISGPTLGGVTLQPFCYACMFYECTNLVTAPALPATTLANACYEGMFRGCESLVTAPDLPATNLDRRCYNYMFCGCKNLVNVPTTLPALSLKEECYFSMFSSCESLESAPILPATNLSGADGCYGNMFYSCKSLKSAPVLPATVLSADCYACMFGSSGLETAPALPAVNLENRCYYQMFYFCSKLTTAPELPATNLAPYCYDCMFYYCSNLETAPNLPATVMASSCYRYMFANCTKVETMPTISATTLATSCFEYMFSGTKVVVKAEACAGYRKPFTITDTGSHYYPTLQMFSDINTEVTDPVVGTTYYIMNDRYSVNLEDKPNVTLSVTPISKGKCVEEFTVTVTATAGEGYGIKDIYYIFDSDDLQEKHYIPAVDDVYSFAMPGNDITIGATLAAYVAEVGGAYYCEFNIQNGVNKAVSEGKTLILLSDISGTVNISSIIFIDFNGHNWGSDVTLNTANVVGINYKTGSSDTTRYSSIENIRALNNINHASSGTNQAAQPWLDLDGDGYINESDVSYLRQKFEGISETI